MIEKKQGKLIVAKAAFIFKSHQKLSREQGKSDPTGSSAYTIPTASVTCTHNR